MQPFPHELLCKIFDYIGYYFYPTNPQDVDLLINLRQVPEMAEIIDRCFSFWLFIPPFVEYEILKSKAILQLRKVSSLFFIITVSEGIFNRSNQGHRKIDISTSWPIVFDVNNALNKKRINGMKQSIPFHDFVTEFDNHTKNNRHFTEVFVCELAGSLERYGRFWPSFIEPNRKQRFQRMKSIRGWGSIHVPSSTGLEIPGIVISKDDYYRPKVHRSFKFRCKRMFNGIKFHFYLRPKDWLRDIDYHGWNGSKIQPTPAMYNHNVARWFDRRYYNYRRRPLTVDSKLRSTWWNTHSIKAQESASEWILLRNSEYFKVLRVLTDDTLDDW